MMGKERNGAVTRAIHTVHEVGMPGNADSEDARMQRNYVVLLAACSLIVNAAAAGRLKPVTGRYDCGAQGATMGLPAGVFTVTYLGHGQQSRAIVPLHGRRVVMRIAMSADGSRYVHGRYTWWEAMETSFRVGDDGPHQKITSCKSED